MKNEKNSLLFWGSTRILQPSAAIEYCAKEQNNGRKGTPVGDTETVLVNRGEILSRAGRFFAIPLIGFGVGVYERI